MVATKGRLDVVATPIGNLADLSARARDTLAQADVIVAEDTRHTAGLLAALGVSRPMVSLHEHNEARRIGAIVERMQAGENVALVSDAGTPLLSDPGFLLVRAAAAAGLRVAPVPGPSALLAALSVAGLPTDRFVFEGFLPSRAGERRARLTQLAGEPRTLVFFEAPHRISATLEDAVSAFGAQRHAVIARELTKQFETLYRGALGELAHRAASDPDLSRGEIVLLIAGCDTAAQGGDHDLMMRALHLLLPEMPPSRAAAIAARLSGCERDEAYRQAVELAGRGRSA